MKPRLIALLIVLYPALVFGGLCHASYAITRVTSNSYEDAFPQIKGDYLVWQGYVGGDWEIFLYNVATGELQQITENNYNDMSPQTDGNYVIWEGFNRTGGEIFLYDIRNDEVVELTNDDDLDGSVQIADGRAVWVSREVTDSVGPGEILLYVTEISAVTVLSASVDPLGALDDGFPRINDTEVAWVQTAEDGSTTLFIHYFRGTTEPAPDGYVWQDNPQRDGDLTVLTRYDGRDREIFLYDTSTRSYEQITNNNLEDRDPSLSASYVTWVGGEGEASEIYVTGPAPNVVASAADGGGGGGGGGSCFIAASAFGSSVDTCKAQRNFGYHGYQLKLLRGFLLLMGTVLICVQWIAVRASANGSNLGRMP
jgi:beta propeller repeat protein